MDSAINFPLARKVLEHVHVNYVYVSSNEIYP